MERVAIIGLGRFGRRLASLLTEAGADVIAIDRRQDIIDDVRDEVSLAVCLNSTDEDALRAQGVDKVDVAVIGIGDQFESAALTTTLLKQMGVKRVICRATSEMRSKIFLRIGADEVVNPESESAERWRNRLLVPAIIERTVLAKGTSLVQLAAPKAFAGKSLGDLSIRQKYQVNVVGIRRTKEDVDDDGVTRTHVHVINVPMAETIVDPGDILLLIGDDEDIASFPAD